jgi:hypothetical protein
MVDLLDLRHIDLTALRRAVETTVTNRGGVATLGQVVRDHPLADGLAELIGYLQVSDDSATILPERREQLQWTDPNGRVREADVPLVLFGHHDSHPLTAVTPWLPEQATPHEDEA